ncbi:hypothetical protein [Acidocella aromatica]|uniref:CelD/BcsL family acetyltransferase involved in cellulose biosynthesis n=1 Tax=Acidocella aromatica TaxID=1303579 RepID=A0A840VL22_9PROT|nr:hypothetical protein [Acidocella aromatica]MBB5372919.1 CelD/BcsL family acetyltransferase involved in cellulose biosynthesis [Acidocella aromatica]
MPIARYAGRMAKSAALWGALATTTLCLVLAGLGFLAAGGFIWLAEHLGAAAAAAATGAALLLAALIITLAGGLLLGARRKPPEPNPMAEIAVGLAAVALEAFANRRKAAKP